MAFAFGTGRARHWPPWARGATASIAGLRDFAQPGALDEREAACLRGAQAAILMRYTSAIIAANLLNGVVLVGALSFRAPTPAPTLWFAALRHLSDVPGTAAVAQPLQVIAEAGEPRRHRQSDPCRHARRDLERRSRSLF